MSPDPPSPVVVISNPGARSYEKFAADLKEITSRSGVRHVPTRSREETIVEVRRASLAKVPIVAVAGGDGTINAAVNGLIDAGGSTALSILPIGTGNDLARTLAIPLELIAAAELWGEPRIRRIDAVALECRGSVTWFANVVTSGDFARVAAQITPEMKKRWGPLAFVRGAIPEIVDPTVYDLRLRLDGGDDVHERLLAAVFANARTAAGGIEVAPRASCEDGLLDIVLVREGTVADLAVLAARYLAQDLLASDLVTLRRARTVAVHANPPLPLSADGEDMPPAPDITFQVLPRALHVLVGPDYSPGDAT